MIKLLRLLGMHELVKVLHIFFFFFGKKKNVGNKKQKRIVYKTTAR